ncbi:hypothetical protein [Sorangium cellulosum]|uniref:Peptidase C39-like domain-containing protein n=1 Tax=Sorangium cellulosum So0157-2 TaxID=1254432 RepID=S4XZJ5_SORCE|nr:hypothetical protein [Sorangium cellulosum]AGP37904.1 hypothetical protein SCE1572_27605 [Sorangium cellulosum So0157-2]
MKTQNVLFNLAAIALSLLPACIAASPESEWSPAADFAQDEVTGEASGEVTSSGLHGSLSSVSSGSVVDEALAKQISENASHDFWYFCGQSATATAINFARRTSPTDAAKVGQLQWFHDRLKARQSTYSLRDPAGPYAARIDWLYNLMLDEKASEFTASWLTTSNRETVKGRMMQALDSGAYVVALNQTDSGVGHYLTVYAIDYQPTVSGGGTVYYGDVLYNNLDAEHFTVFLDRMLAQSERGLYNAFSVKKK